MQNYKHAFLEFAIQQGVLRFGEFTLKSGRQSPYFFNAGLFNTGQALAKLGRFYAQAIVDAGLQFDVLFGPAYKGISLAVATAIALAEQHGRNVPCAFNRKEQKTHGEGGQIIGGPLQGRVLIIDDVITAGTAIRESLDLIRQAGASSVGVVICLDREEKGEGESSAIREIEINHNIKVTSIASLSNLLEFISTHDQHKNYAGRIREYRQRYGV
jgi:orotate phosphoribosyltransferase